MNLGKAQKLLAKGRFDQAQAALGSCEGQQHDPRCTLVLSRILQERGEQEKALEQLDQLRKSHPNFAPAHLFYAIMAGDAQLLEASESAFARVLELQPENELALSYHALSLLKLGRDEQALEIFRKHGFNDNRWFMVRLTEWMESQWLSQGRFFAPRPIEEPLEAEGASKVGFMENASRQRRAQKAFFSKHYLEVLKQLAPLARQASPDPEVLLACALASEMLFDYERALDYLSRIGEKEEDLADPLLAARARNRVRLGQAREAAADLNRVLIVGPEDFGVNYYLGVLCLQFGEQAKARQLFYRAYSDYLVDTLEYQFWQIQVALLGKAPK